MWVDIDVILAKATQIVKFVTLRQEGKPNPDPYLAKLEAEILTVVNKLLKGPGCFGRDDDAGSLCRVFSHTYYRLASGGQYLLPHGETG